jgi:hypothetical protein
LREVAKLFGISDAAVRMRSNRESWNTPKRVQNKLNKAAGLHNDRVARNQSLTDQLEESEAGRNLATTSTDLDAITKEYRYKSADKLFKILAQTIIAPPRTWKDFDIADKMMRRTLGMDDGEGKSSTVVQLQVVNERLRTSLPDEIVEGEFMGESVPDVSPSEPLLCETTGCIPDSESEQAPQAYAGGHGFPSP